MDNNKKRGFHDVTKETKTQSNITMNQLANEVQKKDTAPIHPPRTRSTGTPKKPPIATGSSSSKKVPTTTQSSGSNASKKAKTPRRGASSSAAPPPRRTSARLSGQK